MQSCSHSRPLVLLVSLVLSSVYPCEVGPFNADTETIMRSHHFVFLSRSFTTFVLSNAEACSILSYTPSINTILPKSTTSRGWVWPFTFPSTHFPSISRSWKSPLQAEWAGLQCAYWEDHIAWTFIEPSSPRRPLNSMSRWATENEETCHSRMELSTSESGACGNTFLTLITQPHKKKKQAS